jgi:hypothetical protein
MFFLGISTTCVPSETDANGEEEYGHVRIECME